MTLRFARLLALFAAVVGLLALLVATMTAVATTPPQLTVTNFYPSLTFAQPVDIAHAGDNRLFVVEKAGQIKVVPLDSSATAATTFLDIRDRVESTCPECGLLGLAFHPNYAQNGRFFVNYNIFLNNLLHTRVSQFTVSANPDAANPASETILLEIVTESPGLNHNGGDLNFGPDGYLYVAMGDGGSGGDPDDNGQDATTLLGGILRLDVNGGGLPPECDPDGAYTIPANNPYVAAGDGRCNELWAIGLRNPWRFSFDRATGDLYMGDVGQGLWEEVNFQPASSSGGENYGWNCYEGTHLYTGSNSNPDLCAPLASYDGPIFEYPHTDDGSGINHGRSVTGGYVYRGQLYPNMVGHYIFADFITGNFWSLINDGGWQATAHGNFSGVSNISTFGEDAAGELYAASYGGSIYRLGDSTAVPANLTISKSGPTAVAANSPITYTLTIQNRGTLSATNLTITDTLPSGSSYISGGSLVGNTITWNLADLPGIASATVTLVVSPTQTVVINDHYGVTADGGIQAIGSQPVVTIVDAQQLYLPIVQR